MGWSVWPRRETVELLGPIYINEFMREWGRLFRNGSNRSKKAKNGVTTDEKNLSHHSGHGEESRMDPRGQIQESV